MLLFALFVLFGLLDEVKNDLIRLEAMCVLLVLWVLFRLVIDEMWLPVIWFVATAPLASDPFEMLVYFVTAADGLLICFDSMPNFVAEKAFVVCNCIF